MACTGNYHEARVGDSFSQPPPIRNRRALILLALLGDTNARGVFATLAATHIDFNFSVFFLFTPADEIKTSLSAFTWLVPAAMMAMEPPNEWPNTALTLLIPILLS